MDKYNIGKIMDSIPVSKDKTPEEKLEQIINYLSLCDDDVAIEFIDLSSKTKNNLLQIINPFGKYLESQAKTEKNIERMHSILTELNTLLHKIQFSSNDLYYKAISLLNRNTIDNNVKLEVANIYQSIAELNKIFDETYYFIGDYSVPWYKKRDIRFLEDIRDNINWFLEDFTGLDGIYSDLIKYIQFDIFN
jgi:hypothetical protein